MPGVKIKFSVDPKIPPVRNAYFNVPAALRDAARERLEGMEAQGIIERVTVAPEWISGMSAVPKGKSDFRLVVNMRAPNKAIKREYFRMPLIEEIKVKLHGSRYFTKLDLSNAFYHLELDKESRELTTFLSESGAVLVQENEKGIARIISFASKMLTETEKRYAQNQREALGAVWGVEHFSYFLFGRHFTLRTDAQGVAFVLNRSRENTKRALTRADGWALRLSPYSYTVEYIRGRENIADPSSRLYCGNDDPFEDNHSPWEIATLQVSNFGFLTEEHIRDATLIDDLLQKVIVSLESNVWNKETKGFKALAGDLSVQNGILIKNGCAIIPYSLRETTLNIAHSGHPMTAKMKSIMRKRVWWPGMPTDVEKWVQACQVCATNGRPEKPTPMQRSFAPKTVWHTIAIDFNGPYIKFGGISILVIVDYRSRYLIAKPVQSTSFDHTKKILDEIFDREGYPQNVKSDNGPPFNGAEYRDYCSQRGINCIYSTPYHPQQNGLVEGYMKIINRAMVAAISKGTSYIEELRNAVQAHNAAEHKVTKLPPEEVLSGRRIRRRLPLMCPGKSEFDDKQLDERDRNSKLQGKHTEDARRGSKICSVKPGDIVILERMMRAKGESRFDPKRYTVLEERNGDLLLSDETGQTLKRNVIHTRRVHEWKVFNQVPFPCQSAPTSTNETPVQGRPSREKKTPTHLQDYVRICEQEANERSQFSATQQLK
ncbi:uncharacterized protein K02A2.6-like [Uranotaenia lowii]|uniref:uncharacterized protein K02A2.6-like n=1 Tax=Uranotaenia lowii TaxID=190385 RepID=UPI00247AFCD0|nr:uncharacterized protein K02A2.6-like [Uranotaenia lowii]